MPRLDGLEATRRILLGPNGVDIPIVDLTAKPIEPEALRAVVLKWLDHVGARGGQATT